MDTKHNPNLAAILAQRAVSPALAILDGDATADDVREMLNSLIFALYGSDVNIPTPAEFLPAMVQSEAAVVEDAKIARQGNT